MLELKEFGSTYPRNASKLASGAFLTREQAITVSPYILTCESQNQDVQEVDSSGLMSRGRAQYQDATWAAFSKKSGIVGSPMNATDTVAMTLWALESGGLDNWSCARIEGILTGPL